MKEFFKWFFTGAFATLIILTAVETVRLEKDFIDFTESVNARFAAITEQFNELASRIDALEMEFANEKENHGES